VIAALVIDHVQIAMPVGGEAQARAFFGALLGLEELPKPDDMAGRGGCWFVAGAHQIHLGVEANFRPAKKAHIALRAGDLAELRARFEAAGYATFDDVPVAGRRRFFSNDPFDNRIEFLEATPHR
jgi:catechol 2,3-dioxygenase-like lactoylglutathione lyase family enzyme